jgi:hypothetical protein
VRYYQRADGTILLADCTVGLHRLRDRRRTGARAAALAAGLATAGAMALHARTTERLGGLARIDAGSPVMGGIGPAEPPPPPPPGAEKLHVTMGLAAPAEPRREQIDRDAVLPPPSMKLPSDPSQATRHPGKRAR